MRPILLFLILCVYTSIPAKTIFVDVSATGSSNGSEWENAYLDIQDALVSAADGDEIWVAKGIYKPGTIRTDTIQLKTGVSLLGGFPNGGGSGNLDARNFLEYETILSGDLLSNDGVDFENNDENSYHIIAADTVAGTAVLDGFTITGGNANGGGTDNFGGALYGNINSAESNFDVSVPTIRNCFFSFNSAAAGGGAVMNLRNAGGRYEKCRFSNNRSITSGGGAVYNNQGGPEFVDCIFESNETAGAGGAIWNGGRAQQYTGCSFVGNKADIGGAVFAMQANRFFINCLFSGNLSITQGGAVFLWQSDSGFTNCTFSGNSAEEGAVLYLNSSEPILENCLLWNNIAGGVVDSVTSTIGKPEFSDQSFINISHSLIANSGGSSNWDSRIGIDLGNNIDSNPLFLSPVDPTQSPTTDGNLELLSGSAAIDSGDNAAVADYFSGDPPTPISEFEIDLNGNPRVVQGNAPPLRVDIGAYEFDPELAPPTCKEITTDASSPSTANSVTFKMVFSEEVINFDSAFDDLEIDTTNSIMYESASISGMGSQYEVTIIGISGEGLLTLRASVASDIQNQSGKSLFFSVSSPSILFSERISQIRYVNAANPNPSQPYTSWETAAFNIQSAIEISQTGDVLWVAAGSYTPGPSHDRQATFQLVSGVEIYGGFSGTETRFRQRNPDPLTNGAILTGDLLSNDDGGDASRADNSYHVVTGTGADATAILDGFTIQAGYSEITSPTQQGGGLYCEGAVAPTIRNCRFVSNFANLNGGAIYNKMSPLILENCDFVDNQSSFGGGIYNDMAANAVFTNCSFSMGFGTIAAAVYNNECEGVTFNNCLITGNRANSFCGGIYNKGGSEILFINCTFSGNNSRRDGGAIFNESSSPNFYNCIIWFNRDGGQTEIPEASVINESSQPTFYNCLVDNSGGSNAWVPAIGIDGGDNIDIDPMFLDPIDPGSAPSAAGNFRLPINSPALDRGESSVNITARDLAGGRRIRNGIIDLGSYEGATTFESSTQFSEWIKIFYSQTAEESIIGPLADPDGDKISNLNEFAFGLDPAVADPGIELDKTYLAKRGGPFMTEFDEELLFVFNRWSDHEIMGLEYEIQCSENLENWVPCEGDMVLFDIDAEIELVGFFLSESETVQADQTFFRLLVRNDL